MGNVCTCCTDVTELTTLKTPVSTGTEEAAPKNLDDCKYDAGLGEESLRPVPKPSIRASDLLSEEQPSCEVITQGRRRNSVSAEDSSDQRVHDYVRPSYPKSDLEKATVKDALKKNDKARVLFGKLDESATADLVDAFYSVDIQPDQQIITQGDYGDRFYIVLEGSFDIFVSRMDPSSNVMGPATKVSSAGPGHSFGELALMYNSARAATIISTTQAKVLALDREAFQMLVVRSHTQKLEMYEGWLNTVPILQALNHYELAKLSDLLQNDLYEEGETIIREGDDGDKFFILEIGELQCFIALADGDEEQVASYSPGDYFGEVALLDSQCSKRKATVRASKDSSVYWVCREDFDDVVGPIKATLETRISQYSRPDQAVEK